MSEQELRELDKWIAERVMNAKPSIEAAAVSQDGQGFALWETELITRRTVKEFCESNAQYRYVENEVYCRYSTNPAASMQVLEKCAAKCTSTIEFGRNQLGNNQFMVARLSDHSGNYVEDYCACAPTLPLAICLFAKKLFSTA